MTHTITAITYHPIFGAELWAGQTMLGLDRLNVCKVGDVIEIVNGVITIL